MLLAFGSKRGALVAGTATLALAKIIENMEISHNVIHGQWDWMNDPEIHSSTWEWDMGGASKHWRVTHNFSHHKYTNILGMDDDVGYGILRVTRDEAWKPYNIGNLFFNAMLAVGFEWGIGLQHLQLRKFRDGPEERAAMFIRVREFSAKAARQIGKDYVAYPALTAPNTYLHTMRSYALRRSSRKGMTHRVATSFTRANCRPTSMAGCSRTATR